LVDAGVIEDFQSKISSLQSEIEELQREVNTSPDTSEKRRLKYQLEEKKDLLEEEKYYLEKRLEIQGIREKFVGEAALFRVFDRAAEAVCSMIHSKGMPVEAAQFSRLMSRLMSGITVKGHGYFVTTIGDVAVQYKEIGELKINTFMKYQPDALTKDKVMVGRFVDNIIEFDTKYFAMRDGMVTMDFDERLFSEDMDQCRLVEFVFELHNNLKESDVKVVANQGRLTKGFHVEGVISGCHPDFYYCVLSDWTIVKE
jgi:hypothetical protein